jgi:dTMP kinase
VALTELTAPGLGAVVDDLHPAISVVRADEATRQALVSASIPGAIVIGPQEAMRLATMTVARRVEARRAEAHRVEAGSLSDLRRARWQLVESIRRCAAAEASLEAVAARFGLLEQHLIDIVAAQEALRLAQEELRRAEGDAATAAAALEDGRVKRAEAEATIAEALDEVERGETDADPVTTQIAEVRRALDMADERCQSALDATTSVVDAATERVRRAEEAVRSLPAALIDDGGVEAVGEQLRAEVLAAQDELAEARLAQEAAEAAVHQAEAAGPDAEAVRRGADGVRRGADGVRRGADGVRRGADGAVEGRPADDGPRPVDLFTSLGQPTDAAVVFIEPFPPFPPAAFVPILTALVRLARSTQVVYVTEHPYLIEWAQALPPSEGGARFATKSPGPAPAPRASAAPALTAT